MDLNQLSLEGEIRTEVEYRDDGEHATCSFSILTVTYGKKIYHRIRAWDKWAQLCQARLRRGSRIRIIGPQLYIRSGARDRPECRMEYLEILKE
jgi:single-stranded DNA-binding protein